MNPARARHGGMMESPFKNLQNPYLEDLFISKLEWKVVLKS